MPYTSPEDYNAWQRRRYKENPEPRKARSAAWRAANRERNAEYFRAHNRKRRERRIEEQRTRRASRKAFRFGGSGT